MQDAALIEAVLTNWRSAPVNDRLRATLALLEKLTLRPDEVSSADILEMQAAGVSDAGIEEAIAVCAVFSIADRLADAFDYATPDEEGARRGGEHLLQHGYK